jgi:UDP-N-acetylmuramoyl-tripeptide--D-alanyl-D-alanine ligase
MIEMSLRQVAVAVGGKVEDEAERRRVSRVVIDSREVARGDLFFAIKGNRFDGHEFVGPALEAGATACVCARSARALVGDVDPLRCLWVDDTVVALGSLAAHYRRRVLPASTTVIGVTGSNGKTTTKRMIDHVLSGAMRGRSSPRSFNNHVGVPLTLLSAEQADRYLVVEIGSNARGEVASLAAITEPDVGVITSIGEAHLEGLGNIHSVADEKTSLLDYVRVNGFSVVNTDCEGILPFLSRGAHTRLERFGTNPFARLRVERCGGDVGRTCFELEGRHRIEVPLPGAHHALNATAAFAVGRYFGMAPVGIIERLASFTASDGRSQLLERGGLTIIDDTYNANPTSMAAAVQTLCRQDRGRRVFVMGDMWELGEVAQEAHRRLVHAILDAGIEILVAVGPLTTEAVGAVGAPPDGTRVLCCPDAEAAKGILQEVLSVGDTVLLKGSRAMQLDVIVRDLENLIQVTDYRLQESEKCEVECETDMLETSPSAP